MEYFCSKNRFLKNYFSVSLKRVRIVSVYKSIQVLKTDEGSDLTRSMGVIDGQNCHMSVAEHLHLPVYMGFCGNGKSHVSFSSVI